MTVVRPSTPGDWTPDAAAFLRDVEAKPTLLELLAASGDATAAVQALSAGPPGVLLLGMGSSRFAAEVTAFRLRHRGVTAVAEYASARLLPPAHPDLLVVAISASGTSKETLAALSRYAGFARTVALTNVADSTLARMADTTILLQAGQERGGVACSSFQHTILLLRLLEARLTDSRLDFAGLCSRTAAASRDLLERRDDWLPGTLEALDSADGVQVIAPVERWSSAAQSALMFREGPRRRATASETGDWSHVDVYLTKTIDYRALLLTGSPYDADAMEWLQARRSTVVTVGARLDGAHHAITYRDAADDEVALPTETLVAEIVAAHWWLEQG